MFVCVCVFAWMLGGWLQCDMFAIFVRNVQMKTCMKNINIRKEEKKLKSERNQSERQKV